jgi:hypothetical protein
MELEAAAAAERVDEPLFSPSKPKAPFLLSPPTPLSQEEKDRRVGAHTPLAHRFPLYAPPSATC